MGQTPKQPFDKNRGPWIIQWIVVCVIGVQKICGSMTWQCSCDDLEDCTVDPDFWRGQATQRTDVGILSGLRRPKNLNVDTNKIYYLKEEYI